MVAHGVTTVIMVEEGIGGDIQMFNVYLRGGLQAAKAFSANGTRKRLGGIDYYYCLEERYLFRRKRARVFGLRV